MIHQVNQGYMLGEEDVSKPELSSYCNSVKCISKEALVIKISREDFLQLKKSHAWEDLQTMNKEKTKNYAAKINA